MSAILPARTKRVPANLVAVRELAIFLQEACRTAQVSDTVAIDLELALVEAANNVVEHGYAGGAAGEIALELEIGPDQAVLTLTDAGAPAPQDMFSRCRQVPLKAVEGRGIGIVQSCVDEIAYTSKGGINRLRMTKRL